MAVRESGIYPAWRAQVLPRLAASPGFPPLGGEPSVCPAWQRAQVLPRLAASPGLTSLGGKPSIYLAWRQPQHLSRLARALYLSRLATSPVFTPLGGAPAFISPGGYQAKKNGGLPRRPASANIRAAAPFITLRCATAATFVPLLLWDGGGRRCCLTIAFFCRLSFSTHRQFGFRSICCRALAFTTSGLRGFRLIALLLDRGRFGKCRTTSQQTGKRQ